ncbi:MAG: 23S rRNA (uracil(1939)-C(5))-methyltransferase RlmD [Clostridia bacterium]
MNIPVKKNETYTVQIIDNGYEGEGIAKIEDYTIFIPEAIKGEKCKILIVKTTASHAFGKLLEIIEPSINRIQSDCSTYKRCGGCNLRHINYKTTLKIKQETVQNLVNKILKQPLKVQPTIGMENPYNYRNKAQYPLGYNKNQEVISGIFAARTHSIIPFKQCKIQHPITEKITNIIVDFLNKNKISAYDENTGKGIFRHIVVKVGKKTKQVMCILVVNEEKIPKEQELVQYLISYFEANEKEYTIKTIIKNINTKNTNVILGNRNITLYGECYIYDKLGEYTFKISPMSFYQTNPVQTEVLYNKAIEAANLQKDDILLDLYCGIGTIGIYASKYVKQVYGIEIVEQAIEDAKENAKLNNIENIEFICGDVEKVLGNLLKEKNILPNVIFVDPPRRGLDETTINTILNVAPKKLVYISCNPSTMVRDLNKLSEKYNIQEIQPVDMFPFTSNCEVVSVLNLKKGVEDEKVKCNISL